MLRNSRLRKNSQFRELYLFGFLLLFLFLVPKIRTEACDCICMDRNEIFFGKSLFTWLFQSIPEMAPQSKSDHHDDHFYRHNYLNICNLYCWVETWKGFLEFLFSLIGRFSITRSPERSFIERWRFPTKSWNSERLRVVASLVFGLRISTMWKDIRDEFWV